MTQLPGLHVQWKLVYVDAINNRGVTPSPGFRA
jgi:hypothetical protein